MNDNTHNTDTLREEVARLRKENALYRGVFEELSIGIYVYHLEDLDDDRTLRMVAANPVVEQLAGLPPARIVGNTLDENFPGLREQGLPQAFAEVVRSGQPLETESVYGDERVIESAFNVRAVPLPNHCVAVMFENITARKQAEHALKQANAELEERMAERTDELRYNQSLLQTVLDTSPAAIYIKDVHGRFLLVNQRTSSLLGITPEQMQNKLDTELFPAEFAAQWRANEQHVIDEQQAISIEETVMQEDGLHTFLSTRTPIYDDAGHIYAIGGIASDITERKRQEEELRSSEARQRALLDALPDMMFVQRRDTTFLDYQAPREELLLDPNQFIGKRNDEVFPPDLARQLTRAVEQAVDTQETQLVQYMLPYGDVPHYFEARISPIDGDTVIALVRDVTDARQSDIERAALQQQVIDAQRNALRELSTPLIPISDEVVIMPLIGTIDSQRAQQVMEALLEGVARHQAELVILDITGVSVVDTQVAQAFIQAAQAVRLLGAQVMLTGIQPQIAQTLVHLGVDLSGILTQGSLQAGIAEALHH
jgi:rsbT co-antagonist protein RsbR